MNIQSILAPAPDYSAIKAKQNAAWSAGQYAKIGTTLQITGEELAETMDLEIGSGVLDVAAGNGNATLAFARRFQNVTSTDYVPSLLQASQARAEAEGFSIDYKIADAENLPFEDGSFDAAVSTFGVMFTPDQKKSAMELQRVIRSGGKIGMANWTPDSFIGQLFKTIGKHVPPPMGVKSPALWGDREWIEQTFGGHGRISSFRLKNFIFRYQSAEHFLQYFREFYGPVQKAFEALEGAEKLALEGDIISLARQYDVSVGETLRIPSEYAEIVIEKN